MKSMYEEAIAIYQKAADLISTRKLQFEHFKKVLIEQEATLFMKMA
jgi:hypothetical protein